MKITKKFLSLPPYVSVPWHNVGAIRLEHNPQTGSPVMVVLLTDGSQVEIPHLNDTVIEAIFAAHEAFLHSEEEADEAVNQQQHASPFSFGASPEQLMGLPFRLGPGGLEGLSATIAHSPEQSDAPDLPAEMLSKVAGIAQVLGSDLAVELPEAESGCNCFHCQIARALRGEPASAREVGEMECEAVSDDDLRFRSWDISSSGDHLYLVVNPADPTEKYSVHLGEPLGCTCGQCNCEHIRAVLNS